MRTIGDLLAVGSAGHAALEGPGIAPLTYAGLRDLVADATAVLQQRLRRPGGRIALVAGNGPETAVAFLACTLAGACVPLNPRGRQGEIDVQLDALSVEVLLVEAGLDTPARAAAAARGLPVVELPPLAPGCTRLLAAAEPPARPVGAPPAAAAVALILSTSGTTSRPKAVPLTHGNLVASAAHVGDTLALSSADRCLTVMPLFHVHGLVAALLAPLATGGTVIVPPGFLATEFTGWLARFRPTWYTAVPTMHQAILPRVAAEPGRSQCRAAPLRFVRSSSAALPPRTLADLEAALGVPVIEAYGMTEAAHQVTSNPLPPRARRPGSVGPAAGPEVAVMADDGRLLPAGQIGEVVIRGPNVTAGYLSAAGVPAPASPGTWFRTGDQGVLDEAGYLTLIGRIGELINRAGEKVAPAEIDAALAEHPAVARAVCFGVPHPLLGEEVAAAVVLKPGGAATPRGLREFLAERLTYLKVPRHLVIVDDIPTGATGKPRRRDLGELLGIRASVPGLAGDRTPPRTPLEEVVAAIWADVLARDVPGVLENFFALGGDSMLAMRTLAGLREHLRVDLPLLALLDAPTVAGVAEEVERLLAREPADG